MASKDAIIGAIQVVADATNQAHLRIGFGAPGAHIVDAGGVSQPTGQVWDPQPSAWGVVMEGLTGYLDAIRRITASDVLLASDRIVELGANSIILTLSAPTPAYRGRYVAKALGVTGAQVAGTIDGAAGPHGLAAYEVLRVYCNGVEWLTW